MLKNSRYLRRTHYTRKNRLILKNAIMNSSTNNTQSTVNTLELKMMQYQPLQTKYSQQIFHMCKIIQIDRLFCCYRNILNFLELMNHN